MPRKTDDDKKRKDAKAKTDTKAETKTSEDKPKGKYASATFARNER